MTVSSTARFAASVALCAWPNSVDKIRSAANSSSTDWNALKTVCR